MIGRAAWRAVVVGCGAGLFLTATMLLVRLWLGTLTFPERIAAKPLLFVGIIVAQVVFAGLGGLFYWALAVLLAGRLDLTHPLVGGMIGALLGLLIDFALLPALGIAAPTAARGSVALAPALAQAALPGLVYGLALVTLLRLATPPRARRTAPGGAFVVEPNAIARRVAIALLLSSGGAFVTALALRRLIIGSPSSAPPDPSPRTNTPFPAATATRPVAMTATASGRPIATPIATITGVTTPPSRTTAIPALSATPAAAPPTPTPTASASGPTIPAGTRPATGGVP